MFSFLVILAAGIFILTAHQQTQKLINTRCVKNKIRYPKRVKETSRMERFDLVRRFAEWNLKEFGGQLPVPELRWNSRLRSSAGRFIPAKPRPIIEIATYLTEETDADQLIFDTLGHEIIHYWLWFKRKPYGHTPEFYQIMQRLGVSRYNTVPRLRPFKHCYVCDECGQKIMVRKRLPKAACADCCNQHANGHYHAKFNLRLEITGIAAAMNPKSTKK